MLTIMQSIPVVTEVREQPIRSVSLTTHVELKTLYFGSPLQSTSTVSLAEL